MFAGFGSRLLLRCGLQYNRLPPGLRTLRFREKRKSKVGVFLVGPLVRAVLRYLVVKIFSVTVMLILPFTSVLEENKQVMHLFNLNKTPQL